jgi:hypothetical protein
MMTARPRTSSPLRRRKCNRGGVAWLKLVYRDNLLAAWPLTTPELREILVRAWANANRSHPLLDGLDVEDVIKRLAEDPPGHPLWGVFAETQTREIREAVGELTKLGTASRPRPFPPAYELVLLIDMGGEMRIYEEETTILVKWDPLMLQTEDGWLLAGFGAPGVRMR